MILDVANPALNGDGENIDIIIIIIGIVILISLICLIIFLLKKGRKSNEKN